MSFVHPIVVGHFDMVVSNSHRQVCTRSIDVARVLQLLTEFHFPNGEEVCLRDGYLRCRWLASDELLEFVRKVAETENCYAIEVTQWEIIHRPMEGPQPPSK